MNYLITNKNLILKTESDQELLIDLKKMRLLCPCAHCSGEQDVLGSLYKPSRPRSLIEKSFIIKKINRVGNYGIKMFWKDGHSNGIYTFDFLKKLSD